MNASAQPIATIDNGELTVNKILSSDTHIMEPPDLWTSRIDAKFREAAPRVMRIDGSDWWVVDGERVGSVTGRKKRSGGLSDHVPTIDSKGSVLTHSTFDDLRPGAYIPAAFVEENLADGVVGAVIRPTQGITNYTIQSKNPALFSAICRAYNDWMAEFCAYDPKRLKGMAMLNDRDPREAVRELRRARNMGLTGAIISVWPGDEFSYARPELEVLWRELEIQQTPLSLHVLSNHNGPYGVPFTKVNYSRRVNADHWVRMSIADMIFSGVFERHPGLRVESGEHEGGWVPYFLWQMDWTYDMRIRRRRQATPLVRRPSEYFHDNVYVSIIYDPVAIEAREIISVNRILWGSDFPHEQSTHPRSREHLAQLMRGLPLHEVEAMVYGNVARLFGFDDNLDLPAVSGRAREANQVAQPAL